MQQQDAITHPGQIPIRVFTDQLVVVAFEQNLQVLEDQIVSAINYLEEAQFTFEEFRAAWGTTYMDQEAQDICATNIAAINGNIRAALDPVERAYWNVNALCSVNIKPSIFTTF